MKCVVVGAGAWGLPAAAELAGRGHEVTLVDQYGVANAMSSSFGPTRLWRLADPDPARVRLSVRGMEAMNRLEGRAGSPVYLRRGLLWRDDASLPTLLSTMKAQGLEHTLVDPAEVGDYFPGLRSDGRHAVWQPDAGPVLAEVSLTAQFRRFSAAGGTTEFGRTVVDMRVSPHSVRVEFASGAPLSADVAVVAPGPGAQALLPVLGVDVPVHPYLEQVVHFGDHERPNATDDYPCFFDGPSGDRDGIYAMPSSGLGYKVGLDAPLRDYIPGDTDRTPDEARTAAIAERVRDSLTGIPWHPIDAQVCSWTDSPDGNFIVDVLDGGIVIACGDSGEGFKYSALMGEVLADLAEGGTADPDIAAFALSRFKPGLASSWEPHVLGRH